MNITLDSNHIKSVLGIPIVLLMKNAVCRLVISENVIPVLWFIGYRHTSKRKMKRCRKQLLSTNYWMTPSMTVTPTMWASDNERD